MLSNKQSFFGYNALRDNFLSCTECTWEEHLASLSLWIIKNRKTHLSRTFHFSVHENKFPTTLCWYCTIYFKGKSIIPFSVIEHKLLTKFKFRFYLTDIHCIFEFQNNGTKTPYKKLAQLDVRSDFLFKIVILKLNNNPGLHSNFFYQVLKFV